MNLTFQFKNNNTKLWFKNNLSRLLCEGLTIHVGGEVVYDNTGESLLETYKDLGKSDSKWASMLEYGLANENIRKILSKDDSAAKRQGNADVLLAKNQEILKIKLGQILEPHGPYALMP